MANSEDRNFDRPIPLAGGGELTPIGEIMVPRPDRLDVARVIAPLARGWFLVVIGVGELRVAYPGQTDDGVAWFEVPTCELPQLELGPNGLPMYREHVECPICSTHVAVVIECDKKPDEVCATCPACGYRIPNVEEYIVGDDDDDDEGGGTAER